MALTAKPTPVPHNRLLAALPPEDLARLRPRLEPVELAFRQVLHAPEEPVAAVYFPETGYCSRLAPLEDGDSAEVGLIGPEGMIGLSVLHGGDRDGFELMVQVPGTALRMEAGAFRAELDRVPSFRALLLRYALVHHGQVARTAACNGRHHTDQRLARWLLMAHDRVEGDAFPMTHEFLSMMLGVRRAGVTVRRARCNGRASSATTGDGWRSPTAPASRPPPARATAWPGARTSGCSGRPRGGGGPTGNTVDLDRSGGPSSAR